MENHYTPKEISDKLKLNVGTIYKWIKEERLKAVKLGDVWRIPESAWEEFIAKSNEEKGKEE